MKKLTQLTLSEQTLVKIVAKLYSLDSASVDEFKEELTEEVIHYAKNNKATSLNGTERKSTRSVIDDAVFYFWGHNLWSHRVYCVSHL